MEEIKFVIAGNYKEYENYILSKKLNKWFYRYVYDKIVLFGRDYATVILIGTYQWRDDWSKLNEILKLNESKIIKGGEQ